MKKIVLFALILISGTMKIMADDGIVTATYGNATGNTTRTMTIALNRTTDYVAFQADLTLPEGTTVQAITAKSPLLNGKTVNLSAKGGSTTESTDFKIAYNQNGTTCKMVGYNLGNEKITGTTGDILLTITLQTTEGVTFDASTVRTSNVVFVKKDGLTETAMAESISDSRIWGDVVKDGTVDGKDIQAATNIYGGNSLTSYDKFAADVNGDTIYDGKDIQEITNIYGGQ